MKVKDTGSDFENPPAGTHLARCIGLVGIGTREKEWQGKTRLSNEIIVTWELPHELMSDGRPFIISQFYTRSLADKANLRHALKNWRGRDFTAEELQAFEMRNVLDKGCQVICSENDKGRVKVTGVAGLPKGTTLPDRHNDLRYFDVEEWNDDEFNSLSDRIQNMVTDSLEYSEIQKYGRVLDATERKEAAEGIAIATDSDNGTDDDIPF
jgi:hypothetical protein